MVRRIVTGLLGAFLVAVAGPAGIGTRADDKADKAHHAHGPFAACARACVDCQLQCDSCHHHCATLVAGGKKEHVRTMNLCNDCAAFCATAARIVSRSGPLSATICESCARACDTCGAACEKHPDDEHMKACAKACRDCAKACREMVKHAGHADTGATR